MRLVSRFASRGVDGIIVLWLDPATPPHARSPHAASSDLLRKPDEDLFESSKMSFGEHLEELRGVLIKSVLALLLSMVIGFIFANEVVKYIQSPLQAGLEDFRTKQALAEFDEYVERRRELGRPLSEEEIAAARVQAEEGLLPTSLWLSPAEAARMLALSGLEIDLPEGDPEVFSKPLPFLFFLPISDDPRTRTIGTGIPDAFMVWVKAALLVGVVISSPAVFYFLWSFVASGLYQEERKYVYIFAPFSLGLFLFGAAVAFFLALGYVLDTLFWFYGWLEIDPTPRIGEWLNFALLLPLGFGLGFQLPLVMLFLERIGVFTVQQYQQSWRLGVLVICIASMLLTPSDWQSMVLLAAPMTALYFGGIALCKFMPRRTTPFGDPIG